VLGPTGYTGRLVCEQARGLGLELRLVGRRREALEQVAEAGEEVRVADARDEPALAEAFRGCFAVASCAGPFLAIGTAPVAAAIAAGVHYLDTSGEQAFARTVYERFGSSAAERGLVLLTSFGFDYVPGDLACRLAAAGLAEPLDEVIAAYAVSSFASSSGTRRTVGHVMTQPLVAYENGALVDSRFGATTRRVRFPFGEQTVVEWSGTEPLTVPRHTRVRRVRSYVRAPRAAARVAALARLAAPLVRVTARLGGGPSAERRARSRFAVVAEARGAVGGRRATLTGTDVYGLTALLIARGAEALRNGEARGAGALAPAEAFDARAFAERLAPLLQVEPLEEF
jgi:short subunit dehydrogenase-like uncharacterized protein